ncbi:phosphatidylserine/phosphatidylglycerophosphate/cardiolipin synthase [Collimonas humicola]|uniref:phosphatidylserine/phosphatidylglycerophosphate/ cardiolipin synthase n=1 Tax=Collimonas humicola TaxID=2825886 RepID=UPI001E5437C8|nr:phosphatidylserine/phosphatidylglycerophosphate/cardiolipin synthase [Collimonas humicola]
MSVFAITGVRINAQNGRIELVRWGQVNPATNTWAKEPTESPVIDVVDAVMGGDDVYTIFPVGGNTVLGPKVQLVVYAHGREGIETVDAAYNAGRTLADLPQI